jgi:hypothetical protein
LDVVQLVPNIWAATAAIQRRHSSALRRDSLSATFFFPPSARHSPVLIIKININFHQVKVSPGAVMITAFNQLNEFLKS